MTSFSGSGIVYPNNVTFDENYDTHRPIESNNRGILTQKIYTNINTNLNMPVPVTSVFDPISVHIPLKLKEKAWGGAFIDFSLLFKTNKEQTNGDNFDGDLSIQGGMLSVTKKSPQPIKNIHTWSSPFIIYACIMLEKWPNNGSKFFKYMDTVRLAASRGFGIG